MYWGSTPRSLRNSCSASARSSALDMRSPHESDIAREHLPSFGCVYLIRNCMGPELNGRSRAVRDRLLAVSRAAFPCRASIRAVPALLKLPQPKNTASTDSYADLHSPNYGT